MNRHPPGRQSPDTKTDDTDHQARECPDTAASGKNAQGHVTLEPMNAGTTTISYSRILERRPKAVRLDIGEEHPVWFPLHRITLDEAAYTVTAPYNLMQEKLAEAKGASLQVNPFNNRLVRLAAPSWENDHSIGIDVLVTRLSGHREALRQRVFFPKASMENGAAPLWLVNKKEQALLASICKAGRYIPEQFTITGLRAKSRTHPKSGQHSAPAVQPSDLAQAAHKAFAEP